ALIHVSRKLDSQVRNRRQFPAGDRIFICDAGLGGLARWLRGAGYDAYWEAGISDEAVLQKARDSGGILLTTDSLLMERAVLRDGTIPSLWLPPPLRIPDQLHIVFLEFKLEMREARCMKCGGELQKADKEALRDRIPPRTYRWLEEFFLCTRCDQLFWH